MNPETGVYAEFANELKILARRYARKPEVELRRLFLLALEREEIVSVGYREELMAERLARMPLEEDIRDLVRHALAWIWRDEEMHAVFIRGTALRGPGVASLRVFREQLSGAIGGWAGSVRQHRRWSEAPVSRALSALIYAAGILAEKIPRSVRRHLEYGPFRNFCAFNIEAEKTAHLCWDRILQLARELPDMSKHLVEDFYRIQADEDRHRRIFEVLAAGLDGEDRLVSGQSAAALAVRIGEIGQHFLPRPYRNDDEQPLGRGGPVHVLRGQRLGQKMDLFRALLDSSGLGDSLKERARRLGKPVAELKVAVKPTFMMGYHRKDLSSLTDPALIEELARWFKAQGCGPIDVVEAPNIYDHFFQNRSVAEVTRYFGIQPHHARIVDLSECQVPHHYSRGVGQYTVGQAWKDADFRISFGKMRSHPIDQALLTLGNLESLGTRCDDFLFAERQAHRNTATLMLADAFSPHFALLEAYDQVPDGLAGVMGCPHPVSPQRFYASEDALSLDLVAARHMGLAVSTGSRLLRMACNWFGDPSHSIRVVGADEPIAGWRGPEHNCWVALLSRLSYPVYEFASLRGLLFVPEMDPKVFPPLGNEGILLRAARVAVQALLGLRHPT